MINLFRLPTFSQKAEQPQAMPTTDLTIGLFRNFLSGFKRQKSTKRGYASACISDEMNSLQRKLQNANGADRYEIMREAFLSLENQLKG